MEFDLDDWVNYLNSSSILFCQAGPVENGPAYYLHTFFRTNLPPRYQVGVEGTMASRTKPSRYMKKNRVLLT